MDFSELLDAFSMREGLNDYELTMLLSNPETKQFEAGSSESGIPEDETCSICMEPMLKQISVKLPSPCNHYFHGKCIVKELRKKSECPICKVNVKNELI